MRHRQWTVWQANIPQYGHPAPAFGNKGPGARAQPAHRPLVHLVGYLVQPDALRLAGQDGQVAEEGERRNGGCKRTHKYSRMVRTRGAEGELRSVVGNEG